MFFGVLPVNVCQVKSRRPIEKIRDCVYKAIGGLVTPNAGRRDFRFPDGHYTKINVMSACSRLCTKNQNLRRN